MSPEEPVGKSPLDKPLHQLTEDDISQLTREDCRRYLKQKGMRRPSWNKSQAIQQVISLKKLLETTPSGSETKKPYSNLTNTVLRNASDNAGVSELAGETVSFKEKDPEKLSCSSDSNRGVAAVENESAPPRTTVSPDIPVGQMAIFYCGKVNVYDDVPADKAQAIMHLAASSHHSPQGAPFDGNMAMRSSSCQLLGAGVRGGTESAAVLLPGPKPVRTSENSHLNGEANRSFHEDNHGVEGPAGRKASVQRYLEKRKDRFKSKRKVGMTSTGSLDVCLNHHMGNQTLNEQTSRSNACSPPQIRPPNTPTRCSSAENNAANNANLSAGLNDKVVAFSDMKE